MLKDWIARLDKFMNDLGNSASDTINNVGEQINTQLNEGLTELEKNIDKVIAGTEDKTSQGITVEQISDSDKYSVDAVVSFNAGDKAEDSTVVKTSPVNLKK